MTRSHLTNADMELALADLGSAIEWPATPDLAESVARAIDRPMQPERLRPRWRPLRRGLALGLVAAALLAGLAAAIGFALGGLRISFGGPPPGSPLPPSLVIERAFGREVTLDQARAELVFIPVLPSLPDLGELDHVFVSHRASGGMLTLVWGDRPGLPADAESGLGIVITEFRADIGPEVFEKLINSGVRVERTGVGGQPAYWIEGGDHFFFYRDATGRVVETTIRLVGTTLVWEDGGGRTLRIEGAPSLADAQRVAESLEER
jgi:hypothetical protein